MSEYFNTTDWIFYDVNSNEEFEEDEEEEASVSPINSADERTDAELAEAARHMHIESSSGRNTPSPPPSPPPPQIEEEEHHELNNESPEDKAYMFFYNSLSGNIFEVNQLVNFYNYILQLEKPLKTKSFCQLKLTKKLFKKEKRKVNNKLKTFYKKI